jgi:hypothetical protein
VRTLVDDAASLATLETVSEDDVEDDAIHVQFSRSVKGRAEEALTPSRHRPAASSSPSPPAKAAALFHDSFQSVVSDDPRLHRYWNHPLLCGSRNTRPSTYVLREQ